jgi:hypothetical protein
VTPRSLPLLRVSERISFRRCPQRWWWGWREGLKPQGPPNEKLWFGSGVHLALALWYKPGRIRGVDPRITWKKFVADDVAFIRTEFGAKYDPTQFVEAGEYGEKLITWYMEHWGRDRKWDVVAPEQTFEVIVPDRNGKPIVRLVGTFDGVYRDLQDGQLKLMEHKTAAQIVTSHLALDDQGGTYVTVATHTLRQQGLIGPRETITEVTYNFLRKGNKDERPANADGLSTNKPTKAHYLAAMPALDPKMKIEQLAQVAANNGIRVLGDVSKDQPTPLFKRETLTRTHVEQMSQLRRIASEVEHMNDIRAGYLGLFKNPTKDCSWDCDFYNMCELHEGNPDDALEFRNAVYRVEDPYLDHRKSAV